MGPPSGFVTGSSHGRHAHQGTACLTLAHFEDSSVAAIVSTQTRVYADCGSPTFSKL
jgi:hypothetical protein